MNDSQTAHLISVAEETLLVCGNGIYENDLKETVNIACSIKKAKENSLHIDPEISIRSAMVMGIEPKLNRFTSKFHVVNMTTLSAARRFGKEKICALNFASAKKPGGNFLIGSLSQEEFICRCSALYPCLVGSPMYDYKIESSEYSDYAIYSPDVPVFRDDNYNFLEEPFFCSFVSCAAPNYKEDCFGDGDYTEAMKKRINRVLSIMAWKGYDHIVLGAWGCGSFGHNPEMVASLFRKSLYSEYKGVFSTVTFAILDYSKNKETVKVFEKIFK